MLRNGAASPLPRARGMDVRRADGHARDCFAGLPGLALVLMVGAAGAAGCFTLNEADDPADDGATPVDTGTPDPVLDAALRPDAEPGTDATAPMDGGPADAADVLDGSGVDGSVADGSTTDAAADDGSTAADGEAPVDAAPPMDAGPPPTGCDDAGLPVPPPPWIQVSVGDSFACGLRQGGALWCWGRGSDGQRGDGTTDQIQSVPVRVLAAGEAPGGTAWNDWTAVSTGTRHACGLRQDGSLWCWGRGPNALGGSASGSITTTPVQVLAEGEPAGGTAWYDWVSVSAGGGRTCGIRADGSLWCWGSGRLGDGGEAASPTPRRVLAAGGAGEPWNDWVNVVTDAEYSCGIRADGSLWCWGSNSMYVPLSHFYLVGRLGNGTCESRSTPDKVLAARNDPDGVPWDDWIDVTPAAWGATRGLRKDGSMWRWGDVWLEWWSQCPEDQSADALWPVTSFRGTTWEQLSGDCGRRSDGSLWCWGSNTSGILGNGTTTSSSPLVLAADEPAGGDAWYDWTLVSRRNSTACGLRAGGSAWCWGRGTDGQRGDGTTEDVRTTPIQVLDPPHDCPGPTPDAGSP
jgi:hypothetical protein